MRVAREALGGGVGPPGPVHRRRCQQHQQPAAAQCAGGGAHRVQIQPRPSIHHQQAALAAQLRRAAIRIGNFATAAEPAGLGQRQRGGDGLRRRQRPVRRAGEPQQAALAGCGDGGQELTDAGNDG